LIVTVCIVGILFLLFVSALGPITVGPIKAPEDSALQAVRAINLCLFAYAIDHNGHYPQGQSSTEIFRRLLAEKYANDPTVFYLPLPGKIKPIAGEKLKPENVGFDVTSGADFSPPDELPIVFMTGYKVTYATGGSAVFIGGPILPWTTERRTWHQWWNNEQPEKPLNPKYGIVVAYKSNSATFLKSVPSGDSGGSVPKFVPSTFQPDGKTYRQLTPDGVLPP